VSELPGEGTRGQQAVTFLETPPKQTERQFMAEVRRYATARGWRVYHTYRSEKSEAGFPDLVLVRARHPKPRVVYLELKADRTKVTDAQRDWITDLRDCGQEAYIVRPRHWPAVEKLLR
jgi:hypothetical protein